MFKHGHLEKKLREHGKPAKAQILSIKTEGQGNSMRAMFADDSDLTTGWFLCRLDLRVMPSGERPFETRVHTRLHTLKSRGDIVPVLYDPDDHDKVFVDYKADVEATMHHSAEADRLAQDLAKMEDARSASAGRGAHPGAGSQARLDRLKQLGELHAQGVLTDAEFAQEKARILSES